MAAKGAEKGSPTSRGNDPKNTSKSWWKDWRRLSLFGIPIVASSAIFAAGIIFWGGFNTAMEDRKSVV